MRCGRCGANMLKTELYLSPGLRKLKMVDAWPCDKCGRVEYYPTPVKLTALKEMH